MSWHPVIPEHGACMCNVECERESIVVALWGRDHFLLLLCLATITTLSSDKSIRGVLAGRLAIPVTSTTTTYAFKPPAQGGWKWTGETHLFKNVLYVLHNLVLVVIPLFPEVHIGPIGPYITAKSASEAAVSPKVSSYSIFQLPVQRC